MSELNAREPARRSSLFWRVYMLTWAVLAGGALTYLSTTSLYTSGKQSLTKPIQSDQESNRAELQRSQLTEEVQTLRKTVASLRQNLAKIAEAQRGSRTTAETKLPEIVPLQPATVDPEATSSIKTGSIRREPTVETRPESAAPANSPVPQLLNGAPSAADPASLAEPLTRQGTTDVASAPPSRTVEPAPKVLADPATKTRGPNLAISPLPPGRLPPVPGNFPRPNAVQAPANSIVGTQPILRPTAQTTTTTPVQTAAATAPNVKQLPARPTAGARPNNFGVAKVNQPRSAKPQAALALSTATSVNGLRASWLMLTTQHPTILAGLQPKYVKDAGSNSYRLVAGPLSNRSEADIVCTSLRLRGVNCGIADYKGAVF